MKHFFCLALIGALSFSILNAKDVTEGKEIVTRNGVSFFLDPNSPYKAKILKGEWDVSIEAMKKASKNLKQSKAPAPPVQAVFVLQVYSTQGDKENIAVNQAETKNDHGGKVFQVSTFVYGYGGGNFDRATFAGNRAKQLDSIVADTDNDGIVDGFIDYWDISTPANSSGKFVFTADSINMGPTMSVTLYIK